MVRAARERCESGVYHIIMRGINRQDIFYCEDDYLQFLETIRRIKTNKFELYGYCLMNNHVHLLIHEKSEDIAKIMKRIGTSYARWYNIKYERSGHVFQGRYGSECVETDSYLLTVINYIHKNPVKAGMVDKPEDYRWSSIQRYYYGDENLSELTDIRFILGIFSEDPDEAKSRFSDHMHTEIAESCLEDISKIRKTDNQLKTEIEVILSGNHIVSLQNMEKQKRDEILKRIKLIEGATHRQIARVTGLNQNIIFRA